MIALRNKEFMLLKIYKVEKLSNLIIFNIGLTRRKLMDLYTKNLIEGIEEKEQHILKLEKSLKNSSSESTLKTIMQLKKDLEEMKAELALLQSK